MPVTPSVWEDMHWESIEEIKKWFPLAQEIRWDHYYNVQALTKQYFPLCIFSFVVCLFFTLA